MKQSLLEGIASNAVATRENTTSTLTRAIVLLRWDEIVEARKAGVRVKEIWLAFVREGKPVGKYEQFRRVFNKIAQYKESSSVIEKTGATHHKGSNSLPAAIAPTPAAQPGPIPTAVPVAVEQPTILKSPTMPKEPFKYDPIPNVKELF